MDNELETYVNGIIEQQHHRNGIFTDIMGVVISAIADYRAAPNTRGVFHSPGGEL